MKYIGLDIHKKHTQACVRNEDGEILCEERIRTDAADIDSFFEKLESGQDGGLAVAMEATGFYFWIYDRIAAREHKVLVVHPGKAKPLMRAKAKNDRNDDAALSELLRSGCLEGIYVPPKDVQEMRELTRHRETLVRKKGDLKREILSALMRLGIAVPEEFRSNFTKKQVIWMRSLEVFVISERLDMLEQTARKIENVEALIAERWGADEGMRIIRTVPGIGLVTAAVIRVEIGGVRMFASPERLATYVGLTPTTYQSGEKKWSGPTRRGNSRVKHVLIEALLSHVWHCPDSRISQYDRRKRDAIGRKKALVASARKLMEAFHAH